MRQVASWAGVKSEDRDALDVEIGPHAGVARVTPAAVDMQDRKSCAFLVGATSMRVIRSCRPRRCMRLPALPITFWSTTAGTLPIVLTANAGRQADETNTCGLAVPSRVPPTPLLPVPPLRHGVECAVSSTGCVESRSTSSAAQFGRGPWGSK